MFALKGSIPGIPREIAPTGYLDFAQIDDVRRYDIRCGTHIDPVGKQRKLHPLPGFRCEVHVHGACSPSLNHIGHNILKFVRQFAGQQLGQLMGVGPELIHDALGILSGDLIGGIGGYAALNHPRAAAI